MPLTKAHNRMIEGSRVNVKDFGATGDGSTDDTAAIQAAIDEAAGGGVFVPNGTYIVSNIGKLNAAGLVLIGESQYNTVFKAKSGMTGSILSNTNSAAGTTAFHQIESIFFNLNAQNVTAIDLSSVNNARIVNCYFKGGTDFASATGTGVKFAAPIDVGSYSNSIMDCAFFDLSKGVFFDVGGNHQNIYGGEFIRCTTAIDTQPSSGTVDTPKVFGSRIEGCGTGINEGAIQGMYFGVRFENQSVTDVNFTTDSNQPSFFGGLTAVTPTSFTNISNADSPMVLAEDLGKKIISSSASRPFLIGARTTFAATGNTPDTSSAATDYSVYFQDYALLGNNIPLESANNADTGRIIITQVNSSDEVVVSGFDRPSSTYKNVNIGGGAYVRPIFNGTVSLGETNKKWSNVVSEQLQIEDGITAPGTVSGFASLYIDSADGDLKIKFGDGTVKTIVTDS